MPISISANVLALRHSWGRYGSRTTPACLRLFRTPGRHADEPSSYSLVASPQARLRPKSRWEGRRVGAHEPHHAAGLGPPEPAHPDLLLRPAPRSLHAVAIPYLLAAHSTAPPELTIVLLGGALVAAVLRFRSGRG